MGSSFKGALALCLGAALFIWAGPTLSQAAGKEDMLSKSCLNCHKEFKDMPNVVAGDFQSSSNKAKSISVQVSEGTTQIIKYNDQTKVVNAENLKALQKPIPVRVHFEMKGTDMVATKIVAKPEIKVPPEQLVDVKGMAAIVEKGGAHIYDSRPPIRFDEGHIPGAVALPFPKMPQMKDKLPEDKNALIVFYCGGFR